MGNTLAADTIPVLVTVVDVHNLMAQDMFYFCNISSGGASTKVIGRSQTLSVEVGITTVLSVTVYECPEPIFTPEAARFVGILRIPVERLAERYSSGIFQQWFNLDTHSDPRTPAGDPQSVINRFEDAYVQAVADVTQPKICISVIGSAFEVQRGARSAFSIFVGEDVKTQAGPDLKALIASHKQQAAYIDALHEELRKKNVPSYRPAPNALPNLLPKPAESFLPPTSVYMSGSPFKSLPSSMSIGMEHPMHESAYASVRHNDPETTNLAMPQMHSVARPVFHEAVEPMSDRMTPQPAPPSFYHSMEPPQIEPMYNRSIIPVSESANAAFAAQIPTNRSPGSINVQRIVGRAPHEEIEPMYSTITPNSVPTSLHTLSPPSEAVHVPIEPIIEPVFPRMGPLMHAN